MRPLVKKQPGESVQYTDSRGNIVNHVVQADYEDQREFIRFGLARNRTFKNEFTSFFAHEFHEFTLIPFNE